MKEAHLHRFGELFFCSQWRVRQGTRIQLRSRRGGNTKPRSTRWLLECVTWVAHKWDHTGLLAFDFFFTDLFLSVMNTTYKQLSSALISRTIIEPNTAMYGGLPRLPHYPTWKKKYPCMIFPRRALHTAFLISIQESSLASTWSWDRSTHFLSANSLVLFYFIAIVHIEYTCMPNPLSPSRPIQSLLVRQVNPFQFSIICQGLKISMPINAVWKVLME